jgi:hypothetical protein
MELHVFDPFGSVSFEDSFFAWVVRYSNLPITSLCRDRASRFAWCHGPCRIRVYGRGKQLSLSRLSLRRPALCEGPLDREGQAQKTKNFQRRKS